MSRSIRVEGISYQKFLLALKKALAFLLYAHCVPKAIIQPSYGQMHNFLVKPHAHQSCIILGLLEEA